MSLEILPDSLYSLPSIDVLLKNDKSSIVHKLLSASLIDKKMHLSSVAILLVKKGKQIIQNYDGSPTIVTEKEIVILPKDLYVVSDFVTKENIFEAIVFFIDDELIKKFLIFYTQKDRSIKSDSKIIKIRSNSRVNKYIIALNTEYKGETNNSSQVEIKIIEFLLLLSSYAENKEFISSLIKPRKRRGIKKFMEANYCENLNIEDYASLTGRSVSTFNREFKRVFTTTPNKWLISERLKKSRELLKNTNISVTDVSLEVGYENLSHFISAYKKQYGVTPKSDKTKNND
jgi:AraC-like DNA-binding protein